MKYKIEIKLDSTGETASFEIQNIDRWFDLTIEIRNWVKNEGVVAKTAEMTELLLDLGLTSPSKIKPLHQQIVTGSKRYWLKCEGT